MRLREFFQRLFRRRRARGGGSPHHRPAPQSVEVAASAISSPPVEPPEPMPASPSSPPPQPPAGPPVAPPPPVTPPLATPAPEPPAPATAHAATPAADSWPDTLRLRRLTDELLPPPVATRLLALVRPTIDVVPADVDADLDAASSRTGGTPPLPPQLRWPHRDGAPLSVLAQVRLEEVAPYDVEGALPPSGLLLFFYGGAEDAWGFDPDDRLSWRVLLVDPAGARVRAAPTGAEVFTERGLRPQPVLTLPDRWSEPMPALLAAEPAVADVLARFDADRPRLRLTTGDSGGLALPQPSRSRWRQPGSPDR